MIVVHRHIVTSAMVSSTATNEPAWSAVTTYALSAYVSKAGTRYYSLQASNVGHDPEEIDSLWWKPDGPVNAMRMFDISPATRTVFDGNDHTVTVTPSIYCTTVLMSGVQAVRVRLQAYDGATLKGTFEKTTWTSDGTEWGYDFGEVYSKGDVVFDTLPVPCSHFVITFFGANAVGAVFMGQRSWIGDAEKSPSAGSELRGSDYVDSDGNLQASQRGMARLLTARTVAERLFFNHFMALRERLAGQYAAWIVAPSVGDYDSAIVIGRYQSFDIELDTQNTTQIGTSIKVMGAIQITA